MFTVSKKLLIYFNTDEVDNILSNFNGTRIAFKNENFFVKIVKNTNDMFFDNIIKELNLYQNNADAKCIPKLIDYYLNDEICLIILETISGSVLSVARNDFNVSLSDDERLLIINAIRNIKNFDLKFDCNNNYDIKNTFNKYLNICEENRNNDLYSILRNNFDFLIDITTTVVASHGDLILSNIIKNDIDVRFIDWEYVSFKPLYFDVVFFSLFSKKHNSLEILKNIKSIDIKDCYKDAVFICLKEIYHWLKLVDRIDLNVVNSMIDRWENELLIIIKEMNL